jgi:HSP20 family molecular chaperone IbpA
MKGPRGYMDIGAIFDEIFEAAENFSSEFRRNFDPFDSPGGTRMRGHFDDNTDYYPNYSYPPMNVYMTGNRNMIFEFALAGFDEKDISLSFQGDYMVFSAQISKEHTGFEQQGVQSSEDNIRYFKRRLKLKDIEKQKYYVPLDKYAQENVKAVFKNGILKVTIPPKDEPDQNEGIKIEIVKEGT